jgi:Molybdopterin converting factor, small subunit
MSVTLLLFASYADAFGAPSLSVDLPEEASVADLLAAVAGRPGAHVLPKTPLVAVNQRYARMSTRIGAGDEVALIPPVAGG